MTSPDSEFQEVIESIVKELINEFNGVKEPMHTIIEENEDDEESAEKSHQSVEELDIGLDGMADDSVQNTSIDSSAQLKSSFQTPGSANLSMDFPSPSPAGGAKPGMTSPSAGPKTPVSAATYSDPNMKDGHILFNFMRADITKSMPGKYNIKPENFMDRITFMGRRLVNIWFGKEITVEQFNMFSDLLREKIFLLSFPLMLEAFKKLGHYSIKENGYKHICELLQVCLTQCYLCRSVAIPLMLLSISSACYSQIDGKVVYLREGIRNHQIFKSDPRFWEACILYKTFTNKQSEDKNKQSVFYSTIVRNIMSVAYYMNDILKEKQLIRDVCVRFVSPTLYKVPEAYSSDLVNYVQSIMKQPV